MSDAELPGHGHEGLDPGASPDVSQLSEADLRLARRSMAVLATLGAGSLVGVSFSLYLVNHYPLLLIGLSPIGRHAVLVAPMVDPVAFLLVLVGRRLLFYGACYQLGRALGPTAIAFLERRSPRFARLVRWLEQLFQRGPRLVVLTLAGPTVAVLAGIARLPLRAFLPLATLNLAVRASLTLAFGEIFREPIQELLALINEYWLPGTVVLVVGVGLYQWRQRGRGLSPLD